MKEYKGMKPSGASSARESASRRPPRQRTPEAYPVQSRRTGGGTAEAVLPLHLRRAVKAPRANVKKDYSLTIEIGFVLALLGLIGLFHLRIQAAQEFDTTTLQQEVVHMEEIVQTEQIQKPPPPPRPQPLVIVSDDVILEETELDLDAALDIGTPLEALPPPPAPPDEPEEVVEEEEEDEIFMVVEQMPELIGGIESLQKEIKYPEMARQAGVSGRVFVQFVVDEKGEVSSPVVLRGIGAGCDEEAIRVVKFAKFKPGLQRGKPVKVRYVIPIVFKLRGAQ